MCLLVRRGGVGRARLSLSITRHAIMIAPKEIVAHSRSAQVWSSALLSYDADELPSINNYSSPLRKFQSPPLAHCH